MTLKEKEEEAYDAGYDDAAHGNPKFSALLAEDRKNQKVRISYLEGYRDGSKSLDGKGGESSKN